jgi:tetratricopeptide (TPR) repeat protein
MPEEPVENRAVETNHQNGWLERLPFLTLFITTFLLPIFFIPSGAFSLSFGKVLIFGVGTIATFCLWLVYSLRSGRIEIPNTKILVAGAGILTAVLLSAFFSDSFSQSFIGQWVDPGSFAFLAIGFVAMFLTSIFFRSRDKIFYTYLAFFVIFFVVALFHLIRLVFGPTVFSFGLLTDPTSNIVGKWNDLGVFFGLAAVLSMATLELLPLNKILKILIYVAMLISIFFLAVVNFSPVWVALAIFSVVFFVYRFSFGQNRKEAIPDDSYENSEQGATGKPNRPVSYIALAILVISVIFMLSGGYIGDYLSKKFSIFQVEAWPSWSSTISVAKGTLASRPLLGAGPNRFINEWLRFKDPAVNSTIFWNLDFNYGVGFVPTFLVTTGVVGILSWLLFLAAVCYSGFKAVFSVINDRISHYFVVSSLVGTIFLWVFNIFYTPSAAIVALAFIFTGLFIGSLVQEGLIKRRTFVFSASSKWSFITVLLMIIFLVAPLVLLYSIGQRYISSVYLQKGVMAMNNEGNIDKAEGYLNKAISVSPTDLSYRLLTELDLIRINNFISAPNADQPAEALQSKFRTLLGNALSAARSATGIVPTNYQNWINLGRVYESVLPLKIDGAYESASSAYSDALKLSPHSPAVYLMLGRLEYVKEDLVKARGYVEGALKEKNNYTEAVFLLSQIQIKEGNLKAAISSVEATTILSPSDPSLFFQLGLLRFNDKDYKGAATALERAIALSPSYANAKYFLGLSYAGLGRTAAAIAQFNDLKTTNPDSKEVVLILSNLKAGRPPFANAAPPIDSQPQKRPKLPVKEAGGKKPTVKSEAAPSAETVDQSFGF